jgi:hypothetical protein
MSRGSLTNSRDHSAGLDKKGRGERNILIPDLGGFRRIDADYRRDGTLDVSACYFAVQSSRRFFQKLDSLEEASRSAKIDQAKLIHGISYRWFNGRMPSIQKSFRGL